MHARAIGQDEQTGLRGGAVTPCTRKCEYHDEKKRVREQPAGAVNPGEEHQTDRLIDNIRQKRTDEKEAEVDLP